MYTMGQNLIGIKSNVENKIDKVLYGAYILVGGYWHLKYYMIY